MTNIFGVLYIVCIESYDDPYDEYKGEFVLFPDSITPHVKFNDA